MLVISRKPGQRIKIGDDIVITLVGCGKKSVRIGIDAPSELAIRREEVEPQPIKFRPKIFALPAERRRRLSPA